MAITLTPGKIKAARWAEGRPLRRPSQREREKAHRPREGRRGMTSAHIARSAQKAPPTKTRVNEAGSRTSSSTLRSSTQLRPRTHWPVMTPAAACVRRQQKSDGATMMPAHLDTANRARAASPSHSDTATLRQRALVAMPRCSPSPTSPVTGWRCSFF